MVHISPLNGIARHTQTAVSTRLAPLSLNVDHTPMTTLAENLARIQDQIAAACRAANRDRDEIELMAVSKTYPVEVMAEAAALDLCLFGENRVQEFAAKATSGNALRQRLSNDDICVHFIGHLQSNKAAAAAEIFDAIDSVDSLKLALRLNEAAQKLNRTIPILLEVKLSPEESKHGLDPASHEAAELLERLPHLGNLFFEGLMTIAPFGAPDDETRACFRALRTLSERWAAQYGGLTFAQLSMGMSGDFPLAIAEGATRIRIGTALFGKRPPTAAQLAAWPES